MTQSLAHVMTVYRGSDGEATRKLYADLERAGPLGVLALNLFRAQKNSERAKVYRGRNFKGAAYERKQWALDNLVRELRGFDGVLGITWGWAMDTAQEYHCWVLYVDLPQGQVSFHAAARGQGPDYPGQWDRCRGICPQRICTFCAWVLDAHPATFAAPPSAAIATGATA